jgi:thiol-disulfide isomerase/thioredoxin
MARRKKSRQPQPQPQRRRPQVGAAAQPRPRPLRKPVRRTPAWVAPVATLGVLALLVGAFIFVRWATTAPPAQPPNQDTTASVLLIITGLQPSELEEVGLGSATNTITPIKGSSLTGASGRPVVFYYGAEYCPFCAAERWPLIIALSRFGTFAGLKSTTSSSSDVSPDTPTFTFVTATYASTYLEFQSVEASDRNQNPLQTPSSDQKALLVKYDPSGGIPFIDFSNRYALPKATYLPSVLSDLSAMSIARALQDPKSPQAQAILGSANLITAVICQTTANKPASVCSGSAIQAIERSLG